MTDLSIFPNKATIPTETDVQEKLGESYPLWKQVYDMVFEKYPNGKPEWNYPGKNYGWSFRIKDKKRAILYFLPRENYFMVGMVFGDKALKEILESKVTDFIKTDLQAAKKYAEGRGIRFRVTPEVLKDIERLVEIKLRF
jgi:hypothetical protein